MADDSKEEESGEGAILRPLKSFNSPIKLRAFFELIGKEMFAAKWHGREADRLIDDEPGHDRERAITVTREIVPLVLSGALKIVVDLENLVPEVTQYYTNMYPSTKTTLNSKPATEEELDVFDSAGEMIEEFKSNVYAAAGFLKYYHVIHKCWGDQATLINWTSSLIVVSPMYVLGNTRRRKIDDPEFKELMNNLSENGPATLNAYVNEPFNVIGRLIKIGLPANDEIARHIKLTQHFWAEVSAVVWRYIAIKHPNVKELGVKTRLAREVQIYLEGQGIYAGDKGFPSIGQLQDAVKFITDQYVTGDTASNAVPNFHRNVRK